MFKRLFAAAIVLGAAALAPPLAQAQSFKPRVGNQICGPRGDMVRQLEKKFGETKQGVGLLNAQRAFELWSSSKTGTWTMMVSRADGTSCIIAAGKSWHGLLTQVGQPA